MSSSNPRASRSTRSVSASTYQLPPAVPTRARMPTSTAALSPPPTPPPPHRSPPPLPPPPPPYVLEAVRERERQLLRRRRPRLPHVIARHRNRIEAHSLDRDEAAHVGREPERRLDRIDVRAARDELLQDVVLDRALELAARHTALLPHHHVHREQHGRGRVDGHGCGHAVEGNPVEQARQ